MRRYFKYYILAIVLISAQSVSAVDQPDSGRTLQELNVQPAMPAASPQIAIDAAPLGSSPSGGARVTLQTIELKGNSAFSDKKLRKILADAKGQSYDLAGLNQLANRITEYYHRHNYPFARAIIPEQTLSDGKLTIEVVEGRYGNIGIVNEAPHARSAAGFLSPLKSGAPIKGKPLERVSLLLNDQPGYEFVPIVRPGQEVGTGDLALQMTQTKRYGGSVSADNYGNRYTGQWRGEVELYANSLLLFGDKINVKALGSEENMWLGLVAYNLALGHSGLRGNFGYSVVTYELAKQFADLDAHGTAKIAHGGLSYPILRSQKTNLAVSTTYQYKWLKDEEGVTNTDEGKKSFSIPLAVNFDHRDGILGGGINYGVFTWTSGVLNLNDNLRGSDSSTAKTNGNFNKFNLDVARIQKTPVNNLTFFVRASGQLANDNLDSSEDFGLGGPYGVRAYPTGEGYGDEGIIAQTELRYMVGYFTPYLFYDYGHVKVNHHPWTGGDNHRRISGEGIGLRFHYKNLSSDASIAWRAIGGNPRSTDKDQTPVIWFRLKIDF